MPESSPVEPGAAPHAWRRGGSETRLFSYANDSGSGKPPRHTRRLFPRGRRSKKPRLLLLTRPGTGRFYLAIAPASWRKTVPASRGPMSLEIAGSHHGWSGEDGTRLDLSLPVDDATGTMPRQAARRLGRPDACAVVHCRGPSIGGQTPSQMAFASASSSAPDCVRTPQAKSSRGTAARRCCRDATSASAAITRSSRSTTATSSSARATPLAYARRTFARLPRRAEGLVERAPHPHCGRHGSTSPSVHENVQ